MKIFKSKFKTYLQKTGGNVAKVRKPVCPGKVCGSDDVTIFLNSFTDFF